MAGRHRKVSVRARQVTLLTVATATATAMTVNVAPPPPKPQAARVVTDPVDLAAAIKLLPNHDQVPDLTGGLGSTISNSGQALADSIIRAVVNGINVAGIAQAAGLDPRSLLKGLLADLPANLLPGILASLSIDIPLLGPVLGTLTGGDVGLLTNILDLLGIDDITDGTLTGVLALLGLKLDDPLNLAGLSVPGLNVVTAGPTFTALKMLGLDLGWLPALPDSVANDINGTPYLRLGVDGVLDVLLDKLKASTLPGASLLIAPLVNLIQEITDPLTSHLPDVIDVRVVPTVGIGMGAFAAATAYAKVLAQLASQPGGSAFVGTDPLLGSLTILPLVLINNPARPDGGAFARFGPLAALFGLNTVNPTTQVTSDGTGIPVAGTGIKLGAANVLPVMIDATYEYQPLSDLASWPNPFTLVNNLAAGLAPTYMLRGLSLGNLADQILGQVGDLVKQSVLNGNPLSLNVYLTLHSATLPMLEPLYLASDLLNVVGLSPLAAIPMRLANALAPALSTLVNIGYANTVRNPDGTYTRDFTDAGTETPFLSFPGINYGQVPGDVINQLINGFTKEFFSANPTPNTPNVISNLLNALANGGLGGLLGTGTPSTPGGTSSAPANPLSGLLNGLGGVLGGILGGLGLGGLTGPVPLAASNATASSIPEADATFSRLSISAGTADESDTAADASKTADPSAPAKDATAMVPAKDETTTVPAKDETATVPAKDETATVPAKDETATVPAKDTTKDPAKDTTKDPAKNQTKDPTKDPKDPKAGDQTGPKHAKPDDGSQPTASTGDDSTPAKHAKPDHDKQPKKDKTPTKDGPSLNVVRDGGNSSHDGKPAEKHAKKDESGKKDAADSSAGTGSSTGGSASGHAA